MSVIVPLVVPFSTMFAPMMGSPSSSRTFPLTAPDWAKAAVMQKDINTESITTLQRLKESNVFFRCIIT